MLLQAYEYSFYTYMVKKFLRSISILDCPLILLFPPKNSKDYCLHARLQEISCK